MPFGAFFLICCFFSIDSHDIKVKQGQVLCVQRRLDPADESTLTMPDMLSSFGSEFWMKNRAGIIFYNSNIWCLLQKVAWLGGPNVAPSSQQKHKQSVEKNLQRVKKTTFFFVKVHDFRVSNTSLSVYNADRIRLRSPLWPHLTSWPALGINPGWKIGYQSFIFQPFAALLELCSFSSFHRTRRHQDQPRPGSPCTTPAGSGRGVHSDHTWQADQPWESIQDEKSGTFLYKFQSFGAFLGLCSFPLSTDLKDSSKINQARLSMYNADRIGPRSPPWPHLTGWPALGVNPG